MDYEPKSIDEQIDCLARLTGAPDAFVAQVRQLFTRKGISLEEDATPYLRALEEAFVREESIRADAREREERELNPTSQSADRLAKAYLYQINRLRRVRHGPHQAAGDAKDAAPVEPARRNLVVPHQRDDQPLVPGPEDLQ